MKVLLFSGDHPRHLFVHAALRDALEVCGAVCMRREEILPEPPTGTSSHDADNFRRHFRDRFATEQKYFGAAASSDVFAHVPVHACDVTTINTPETAAFVKECAPDVVVVFGAALIKEPVLSALPKDRINIHMGLSPWYRGAATLFWPFYNMQPQYCGATIHQIVPKADAGAIIHQAVPTLKKGDGIHDVAARTVVQSSAELVEVLKEREKRGHFIEVEQRTSGRLYRERDFRPEHLRVIYDLFNNDMVDAYLRGEIRNEAPELISGLDKTALT